MRKIEVTYFRDKYELFRDTPEDESTGRISGATRFYEKVLPITIPAKTVYTVKLRGGFWNSSCKFSQIWEANKVMLSYRDGRNKEKKILITKDGFDHYFESHSVVQED